jgi:hypothetical protein
VIFFLLWNIRVEGGWIVDGNNDNMLWVDGSIDYTNSWVYVDMNLYY